MQPASRLITGCRCSETKGNLSQAAKDQNCLEVWLRARFLSPSCNICFGETESSDQLIKHIITIRDRICSRDRFQELSCRWQSNGLQCTELLLSICHSFFGVIAMPRGDKNLKNFCPCKPFLLQHDEECDAVS